MTYGLIVPTLVESGILIGEISKKAELVIQNKLFYTGELKGNAIVLCVCGIGKTNAAHGTALLIEKFHPASVHAAGVAGAYPSSGLQIGDIAVGTREIYADEGLLLESGVKTMDELGLPLASVGSSNFYNEFPLHLPKGLAGHINKGPFVTVSACTGTFKRGLEIESQFQAICENMEGAAIAHVCLLNNTPVTEVRGISNIIEDRGGKPLDKSAILDAAAKTQKFLMENLF